MPPRRREAAVPAPAEPDLVLVGRGWFRGRPQPLEVGIDEDGRIVRVGRDLRGRRRHDVGESWILPSATDLHVHFRDPGPPGAAESFATGTRQAVLGGVAVVGDMPNTDPAVRGPEAVDAKSARVRGRAACDVLLYGLAEDGPGVRRLAGSAGALKLYTSATTGVDDPVPPASFPSVLEAVRRADLPMAAHAEDPAGFRGAPADASDPSGWDAHRPADAERAAAERLLAVGGTARLHLAHVTTADVLERVRAAGHSAEVTPHHLLLSTGSRHPTLGLLKANPPLRPEPLRAALLDAFRQGRVPVVASDHAPHPEEAKSRRFAEAPSGIAGVETMVPLLLGLVARGELPLPAVVGAVADRPARWFGRPHGRLAPGHLAHLIVVDFRARRAVRGRDLHGSLAETPFEGFEAVFPSEHYLAGERVVDGGEYVGRPTGRVVRPEFARGPGGTLA